MLHHVLRGYYESEVIVRQDVGEKVAAGLKVHRESHWAGDLDEIFREYLVDIILVICYGTPAQGRSKRSVQKILKVRCKLSSVSDRRASIHDQDAIEGKVNCG